MARLGKRLLTKSALWSNLTEARVVQKIMDEKSAVPDQALSAPAASQAPAPATPATQPDDELFPAPDAPAQNSTAQKISAATGGLFEKFGWKRGPGRPRKDGQPNKSAIPIMAPAEIAGENGGPPAGPRAFDSTLVKRCVASIGKAACGFFDKQLEAKAVAATGDRAYAAELVKQTTATSQELDALGEVTDILLKQMGVDTRHLPLICACTVVAGAGARYAIAFRALNAEMAKRHSLEAAAKIQQGKQ